MAGAIVIGAGPGLGAAVARRFAREGLPVGLIARRPATLDELARSVTDLGGRALTVAASAADEEALRGALDQSVAQFGVPDALVYNAAAVRRDLPGELTAAQHADTYAVNVLGALTAATHLAPAMAAEGHGTILITAGLRDPDPRFTSLSLGKAAVRAAAKILDQQFGPAGVRVATVTICGLIAPRTAFDPDAIAERYWSLHHQPPEEWEPDQLFTGFDDELVGV
jgi:NAD(P)-dependent dehydrogenase (short-subunit alcohol dehydrogenase family)